MRNLANAAFQKIKAHKITMLFGSLVPKWCPNFSWRYKTIRANIRKYHTNKLELVEVNNMQYAIELYYDKETEQKLFNLAKRVADEKLSTKFLEWKTRPHLTLACFNDVNETKCIQRLNNFAKTHKPMPAYIGSIGMFNDTRTIFASPVMNGSMYQFQRELHEYLQDFDITGWEWYCPDRWVPHCTLALTKEDDEEVFYKASDLILHEFRKMSGKFVSVGLVKISFPVEEIYTIELDD